MSVSISPNSQTRWLRVLQERRWYGSVAQSTIMSIISLCKLKQLQCPSRCILQLSEVQLGKCSVFTDALGALFYGHSVAVTGCCRQMTENFEDVDLHCGCSCVLPLFYFSSTSYFICVHSHCSFVPLITVEILHCEPLPLAFPLCFFLYPP